LVPVTSSNNYVKPQLETSPILVTDVLRAGVYPNPHRGSFTLRIESPEEGAGSVEMYNASGQMIGERKVNLMKGKGNLVQYYNMNQAVLFYRVRIGKHVVNGKIIGLQ
ncbi:MAG TPA: T9SS type A sorting domain-containing protein, partial [Lacibacter sp.]|nr:T9SS type A sorting domain-containing protein [Lacibacter sp.]